MDKEKDREEERESATHVHTHTKQPDESPPEKEPKAADKSTPKCFDDVAAYFAERKGSPVEAEKFYNHYSANGWKVGRNPMKDWKAAVRKWLLNTNNYGGNHANNNGANTPRFGERVEPTIEQLKSDTERRKAINEQFQRRRLADGNLQLTGNGTGN